MSAYREASYDRIAQRWDRVRRRIPDKDQPYFDLLVESLKPCSRVLDLGCGTGRPNALALSELGHRVDGVDESEQMLALAREYVPDATFTKGEMSAARLNGPYDGAVCWDALFHVARGSHEAVLRKLFNALTPGGRLIFTIGGSDNPPFHDQMFGETFFYDSHPPDDTIQLVRDVGFEIIKAELVDKPDGGRDRGRLAIVADKV